MDNISEDELKSILSDLAMYLTERLSHFKDWEEYWAEVTKIIEDLKKVGHELYSHDYDGESKSLWGWNYMKKDSGKLQIQFDFNGKVSTYWKDFNVLLGTTDDK